MINPPPKSMEHLPRDRRGLPVPRVVAWSSEAWNRIDHDPLVGRAAVFTAGGEGQGVPVLGVLNEPRQRWAMVTRRCQVCGRSLRGESYLPTSTVQAQVGETFEDSPVTTEPPGCLECMTWSLHGCPVLHHQPPRLQRMKEGRLLLQLVDPSLAPAAYQGRFGKDFLAKRVWLGEQARRHGGAVGYVKLVVDEMVPA